MLRNIVSWLESRKLYARLIRPLLLAAGIFYFTFHTLGGERGLYALLKEERKLEVLHTSLESVSTQRKDLERRVRLMSANSLDLDLVDEQVRSILGAAKQNELVILRQDDQ